MKLKRFIVCLIGVLFILPFIIGVTPSLQWGDTPLKTNLPPVIITGKSTFKILETRRIPIPSPFLPGGKKRPVIVLSATTEPAVPEENKRQPTPQTPGCAYRNSVTARVATLFKGAEAYDKRGKYLFLNRRYNAAIETFSHLIETYPESNRIGEAYFWIGESYFQMEDIPHAEQNFRMTVQRYPSSAYTDYAYYSLGWISYRKKAFEWAVNYFKQGVLSYPNSPIYDHMLFWLAESYMQKNETEQAYTYFTKVLKDSSDPLLTVPTLFEAARIQFLKKDFAKSKETLKRLLKRKTPDTLIPKIYLLMGWCEYFLKDPNALATFAQVLKAPKVSISLREEAYYGKSLSAVQQGKPEIAEKLMGIMGPSSQWYGEVAVELANYYFNKKDYKRAGKLCGKIFQNFPKTPYQENAYMILGNSAYNTRDYSHATEYYTRVILGRVNQLKPMATFAKGLSFYQIGRFRDAIDSWEILLKRYPSFPRRPEALYWLGSAYLNLHQEKSAVFYFNQLKNEPDYHPKSLMQLAEYWFGQQAWGNTLNTLKQFLSLYPRNVYVGYAKGMVGEIYFNLKDYKKASRWLSEAIKDAKIANDLEYRAKIVFILGQVYYRMGDFKQAITYFSYVSSKLPRNSFDDDAQYWRAMSYYSQQAFKSAILSFKRLLKEFPQSPLRAKAMMKMADCYYNLKDYTQSDAYYHQVASQFKDKKVRENAAYGRILSLYQRGAYAQFFTETSAFMRRFPNSPLSSDVVQLLAEYYERLGDIDKEIELMGGYLKAHKVAPQADALRLKLARLLVKRGLYDSALVQLRLVSNKSPHSPFRSVAEKEMGDLYFERKLYHEAIVHYKNYLASEKLPPETACHVRKQLASAFIYAGELESAAPEIKLGAKSYGVDWAAPLYLLIGEAYQQRKMYKYALNSFTNAAKATNPGIKCRSLISIAGIYRKTKKYDKSLKTLLMVRYSYPECRTLSERALLDLAVLLGEKGRSDEARQLLSVLVKSHDKKVKRLAQKALNRLH